MSAKMIADCVARAVCRRPLTQVASIRRQGGPAVVKDKRDMANALGARRVDDTKCQVVILAAVKSRPEFSDLVNELGAKDAKLRNTILRQKKVRIPIAFEMQVVASAARRYLVFVAIDQIDSGVLVDFARHEVECMG